MALHHEIYHITDSEENARDFLFQRGILKTSIPCPSCSADMTLVACAASKSPDLLIWQSIPQFLRFLWRPTCFDILQRLGKVPCVT